jgi:chorismate mutase/prephenate dehydratase
MPRTLEELRAQIDAVDTRLLELLNERADLVHEVGEIKRRQGLEIYAPEREDALLQRLVSISRGRLPARSIRAIYREIMSAALALEEDLKIAFLGPAGTWTHQAAVSKFGNSVAYVPQTTLADVFREVEHRHADYGVVPLESTTEGAAHHTLDLFADSPLKICAQIRLPVESHLMASTPDRELSTLCSTREIFGECRRWIADRFPHARLVEVASTSEAASIAAADPASGVIGSALLADLHGFAMRERSVQDSPALPARFLVIGHRTCPRTGNDRTSIVFSVRDEPGALQDALEPFHRLRVNLAKIESRPMSGGDSGHLFHVDVAGHGTDPEVQTALEELRALCTRVKILGSYPDPAER